jgi:uncharacterized integral membrane protein (TIGR00698 family)
MNPMNLLRISVLLVLVVLVFLQYLNAGLGLMAGLIFALTLGNPFREYTQKWAGLLLKASVVGLGFGLDLETLWSTTQNGIWLTISTIFFALFAGLLIGRLLGVQGKLSMLISTGTAICGGSAIAAMSPTINAKQDQTVIAISIVFILNGIALYVFPLIGNYLELTQQQFGLWAALGIHDTSSVVGASALYGEEALNIATTTKLARALWIIPLVVGASIYINKTQHQHNKAKISLPYFIFLFILAAAVTTFVPAAEKVTPMLVSSAKIGLVLSLLFMGAGITKKLLKTLDARPMIQAVVLWLMISSGSLMAILYT